MGQERTRVLRNIVLYVDTFLSIGILGWVTYFSGGPLTSPYSVILISVALISPFITDSMTPAVVVSVMVGCWYLFWWYYSNRQQVASFDRPGWLIFATTFVSVIITMLMEYVRRQREKSLDASSG